MPETLRQEVRARAQDCCEYCRLHQDFDSMPFQLEHIIAEKHHGPTTLENLAWSCLNCNVHKGSNIAGLDPETGELTRLFHPRADTWKEHFKYVDARIVGRTPVGRTTIDVLNINLPERLEVRRLLLSAGLDIAGPATA
jgi:hypothetical protein